MDFYQDIISLPNLFTAWEEFVKGKRKRKDVAEFSDNLSSHIYELHLALKNKTYEHSTYHAFNISDPKPRNIHKASVRDRLLHHAVYRILYPYFDKKFIADSYSCRLNKGTHKALLKFEYFTRKVSKNYTKQCWVLKCDVRKFFASVDQDILLKILEKHLEDKEVVQLFKEIISSFPHGLPLGNLTSQLLVNIYMNEFDQFMKHKLRIKYYIRYADDFAMIYHSKRKLEELIPKIQDFLRRNLNLDLHPHKVFIKTIYSGVDFLGWVHFPRHRVLRTVTKRRMLKKVSKVPFDTASKASYLGMLKWGNTNKIKKMIG